MQNKLRFIFILDLLICLQMLQMTSPVIFFIEKYKVKSTLSYAFLSRFFRTFAVEMRESVLNIIMTVVALAVLTGCSGDKAQRLQQLEQLEP